MCAALSACISVCTVGICVRKLVAFAGCLTRFKFAMSPQLCRSLSLTRSPPISLFLSHAYKLRCSSSFSSQIWLWVCVCVCVGPELRLARWRSVFGSLNAICMHWMLHATQDVAPFLPLQENKNFRVVATLHVHRTAAWQPYFSDCSAFCIHIFCS